MPDYGSADGMIVGTFGTEAATGRDLFTLQAYVDEHDLAIENGRLIWQGYDMAECWRRMADYRAEGVTVMFEPLALRQ